MIRVAKIINPIHAQSITRLAISELKTKKWIFRHALPQFYCQQPGLIPI
jgi:hypothetical protein